MDIRPLERFATWARRELLSVVDAQASTVLANGSVPRTEHPEALRRLESEIENHGRQHIIDKVAYTWFNRIIALRFMDVRGYTDAGVVSPVQGQEDGQPEILSDAKRGNLDSNVVTSKHTEDAVLDLIDGTRHSTDAEGEAYAMLLTEYCRYWHKSMPFMFQREGDYTELLVPANLLADGAILSRARKVLTEEVCEDVEVIGWLYQFYISERKEEIFASKVKRGAKEIPAATQLFTPHWIVRYLVENSIGRLWMLNHPESRLIDQMEYYIAPVDEETGFLKISGPEELTVIDPACGSGHMLTYAFDLLYTIYEEEGYAPSEIPGLILTHNLHGTEIDPRAGALAAFALTMKARAKQRTFFNREMKPQIFVLEPASFSAKELDFLISKDGDREAEEAFWNQFALADVFGSLLKPNSDLTAQLALHLETIDKDSDLFKADLLKRARVVLQQARWLTGQYHVVIANPPYMGNKNMGSALAAFSKDLYTNSKSDLYAMFLERSLDLSHPSGFAALVTMQSWMFLSTYANLRQSVFANGTIVNLAHLGSGAFDTISGEIVQTVAVVLEKGARPGQQGVYLDVTAGRNEGAKSEALLSLVADKESVGRYEAAVSDLSKVPGMPIAYWLSATARALFSEHEPLGRSLHITGGMTTGDNERFLRRWFEVSKNRSNHSARSAPEAVESHRRWFPYNKGGGARSWFGNRDFYVNWEGDGCEILSTGRATPRSRSRYFQESLTYSATSSSSLSIRYSDDGFIFDAKGSSCFSDKGSPLANLGYLASSTASYLLRALNPTIEFQTGDLSRLPNLRVANAETVQRLVDLARADETLQETCWDFLASPITLSGSGYLGEIEADLFEEASARTEEFQRLVLQNNEAVASAAKLDGEVNTSVSVSQVTLEANPIYKFGAGKNTATYRQLSRSAAIEDLVSYAVGCMFGRYSLDEPGLILADQGATLQDYLAKVPSPTFIPEADNVIPFVDDGWFEDDIVERFRMFLRVTFGAEQFEENLRFVEESLGVKTLRDYFMTKNCKSKFYEDHVKRYKKRPIYWMFSSPKGSFNALIYMHRYNPSTVSTVLNEYLREYRAKLEVALTHAENVATGGSAKDQKEADRLRRVLVELAEYENDVLYPLATRQLPIDLDDGVLVNYLRFGGALKDIGLENNRKKVEGWAWPTNKLEPLS